MDPATSSNLEEQIRQLRSRVHRLEETLYRYGIVVSAEPEPPAATPNQAPHAVGVETPAMADTQPPTASPAPPSYIQSQHLAPAPPRRPEDTRSLESRIGSQWFNRIGILAILIAAAWFLKFAIDSHWIGPSGRVLIGLATGAGLIAWSERFQRGGYVVFAYSLKATGSGILYLSLWAAFSLYHLIPSSAAFLAMILVTAFNGFMSWRQDSELLALYAIAGGLSTPLLLTTGENHEVALFGYLLLLDVAVLILVILRPWSRLLFCTFLGTVLFYIGWSSEFYSPSQLARTMVFLTLYFLIFAFAPRLICTASAKAEGSAPTSGWDTLALVLMPVANAALGFLAYYALVEDLHSAWAASWLAVVFAAFYLLLQRLPARGRFHASPAALSYLHLTAAVVFLTIAIPLKTHGRWLTIGWLVEGAALLWVARRVNSLLLRVLSVLCLVLGLFALLTLNPQVSTTPIFNQRFATCCVAIATFAFVIWIANKAQHDEPSNPNLPWPALAALAVIIVNALILLSIGWEIHNYWWLLRWHGDWLQARDYRIYAQFTYSAFFMLFGAILLTVGFWLRSAFLRWQALLLLAVTIGKVFLVDISQLSQGYRIVSFLGLGVLLLAVSFVYQRDLLKLHEPAPHDPNRQPS